MIRGQMLLAFLLFLLGAEMERARGEPWLSTRYANNCAGCHAPGRKNLKPVDRRCSLSCQGCHVNPNGGGLRSTYGKWNENVWLRSFAAKFLKNQPKPEPLPEQKYLDKAGYNRVKAYKKSTKKPKFKIFPGGPLSAAQKKAFDKVVKEGYEMKTTNRESVDESDYDKDHDLHYQVMSDTRDDYEFIIPKDDSYRQMEYSKVDGGADFRLVHYKAIDGVDKKPKTFLMNADFGLRLRPFYRKFHIVYEGRYIGTPVGTSGDSVAKNGSLTRSFYGMVDDLPFNIFVMGGYYRPLFGNYVPDHTSLAQRMISQMSQNSSAAYNLLYRAVSIGTAPNVPYLNVHMIGRRLSNSLNPNGDPVSGYAANLGLRFVTLGASLNFSIWDTTDKTNPESPVKLQMHSGDLAVHLFNRLVVSLAAISFQRDDPAESFRKGGVMTMDTKFRFFRENYLTLELARSNVTERVEPGNAVQTKVGTRHFLIPGLELILQYNKDVQNAEDVATGEVTKTKKTYYSTQLHTYF